jgi:hypothetical protein
MKSADNSFDKHRIWIIHHANSFGVTVSLEHIPSGVERWLNSNPGRAARLKNWLVSLYYQKIPIHLRLPKLLHSLFKICMAASAPTVSFIFYKTITIVQASGAFLLIAILYFLVWLFDRVSSDKQAENYDIAAETVIRVGEILGNGHIPPNSKNHAAQRDDAIRAALGLIEVFTRQVCGGRKGEISVTLAKYVDESNTQMEIRHRNTGNTRPTSRKFSANGVLGHYACMRGGAPRVVNDIKRLGPEIQKSPTQSEFNYRSILFLPLVGQRGDPTRVTGFLSIDSTKAYCFSQSRVRIIVVNCQSILEHVQKLC